MFISGGIYTSTSGPGEVPDPIFEESVPQFEKIKETNTQHKKIFKNAPEIPLHRIFKCLLRKIFVNAAPFCKLQDFISLPLLLDM